ncbi:Terpenoid synthase [Ophiocordyceps sinensis CO18]|uniref:Terpenoid synthase n=1 Tax=Ophiocordyceps sinensis (strain Co18 / CGMCC 3.14243) TaxID=911162 RepID=T5AFF6_OPHSC|nr:Terpenoid synthase [Ophiocordyceps sinensis CO18]
MMNEMGCGLPGVMAQVVEDLKTSIRAVDETADAILAETRKNETLHKDVQKYMHGLKTPLTGNWNWSLATRRYGIQDYVQKDGSLDIPL